MQSSKLSAMEFFVLATISRGGLASLYELQRGVGLQPGGIQPVLKRLEAGGLLDRSEQQRRRRRTMTLTCEGERILREYWRDCLQNYPDVESTLRAATVALLMNHQEIAHRYLMGIADLYELDRPSAPAREESNLSPVNWYTFMRRMWDVERHESAAKVFRSVATELVRVKRD